MAFTAANMAMAGFGLASVGSSIAGGYAEHDEYIRQSQAYQMEAQRYEHQAQALEVKKDILEQNKILARMRYAKERKKVAGTVTARTAKAGFMMSGSPLVVMVDNLTNIILDEKISEYNVELEKYNVYTQQYEYRNMAKTSQYRSVTAKEMGKASLRAGYSKGFTQLLGTASGINWTKKSSKPSSYKGSVGKVITV